MAFHPTTPVLPQLPAARRRSGQITHAAALLVAVGYAAVVWHLLLAEHGDRHPSLALFAIPSAVAGIAIARPWAGAIPFLLVLAYLTVGLPMSPSDRPESTMVVAFEAGVVARHLGWRLPGRRRRRRARRR